MLAQLFQKVRGFVAQDAVLLQHVAGRVENVAGRPEGHHAVDGRRRRQSGRLERSLRRRVFGGEELTLVERLQVA